MAIEEGTKKSEESNVNQTISNEQLQNELASLRLMVSEMLLKNEPVAAPTNGVSKTEITQLVDELQGRKTEEAIRKGEYVNEANVDPDDVLPEPAVFYCHKGGYFLAGDVKNGVVIAPPRGNIFFEFKGTLPFNRNAKEQDIINISQYKTFSKKQRDFLLNHSFFNVFFHHDIKDAINFDTRRGQKMAQRIMQLQHTEASRLLNIAKSMNIPTKEDVNAIRVMIATKMVDDELKNEKLENEKRTLDAVKDVTIFGEKK